MGFQVKVMGTAQARALPRRCTAMTQVKLMVTVQALHYYDPSQVNGGYCPGACTAMAQVTVRVRVRRVHYYYSNQVVVY